MPGHDRGRRDADARTVKREGADGYDVTLDRYRRTARHLIRSAGDATGRPRLCITLRRIAWHDQARADALAVERERIRQSGL
ncbi:hypothetical protein GCM10018965_011800 [Nonomuraea roseola]